MEGEIAALFPTLPELIGQMGVGAGGHNLVIDVTIILEAGRQTGI